MDIWLTLRTFSALFLAMFGIGLVFARSDDMRIMLGSFVAAIGLTFMLRMGLALRRK